MPIIDQLGTKMLSYVPICLWTKQHVYISVRTPHVCRCQHIFLTSLEAELCQIVQTEHSLLSQSGLARVFTDGSTCVTVWTECYHRTSKPLLSALQYRCCSHIVIAVLVKISFVSARFVSLGCFTLFPCQPGQTRHIKGCPSGLKDSIKCWIIPIVGLTEFP